KFDEGLHPVFVEPSVAKPRVQPIQQHDASYAGLRDRLAQKLFNRAVPGAPRRECDVLRESSRIARTPLELGFYGEQYLTERPWVAECLTVSFRSDANVHGNQHRILGTPLHCTHPLLAKRLATMKMKDDVEPAVGTH